MIEFAIKGCLDMLPEAHMIPSSFKKLPPPPLSPPPSVHTNHKPAGQSAHQQLLSAVHKALYRAPFLPHGISFAVQASFRPKLCVFRAALLKCLLSIFTFYPSLPLYLSAPF